MRAVWAVRRVPGSFAALRMTAKTYNGNDNGNGNGNGNSNGEIQGSLHYAADDGTVRCVVER